MTMLLSMNIKIIQYKAWNQKTPLSLGYSYYTHGSKKDLDIFLLLEGFIHYLREDVRD